MWLVAGLGNPGAKYERNRHNIGFLAVERIAEKMASGKWQMASGRNGLLATGHLPPATKLYFLKPQSFMNLSGESVAATARFYKIPPENIIVFYDELDLLPGKLRVKQGGGSGGHNGIKSIDAHMGEHYQRVRIGIGHPGHKDRVTGYVLSDFSKEEWTVQDKMLETIAREFPLLIAGDAAKFMNKVALTMTPPPAKEKPPPKKAD